MKIAGEFTFQGPRPLVWELLQDPKILSRVLPGVQKLEKKGENQYAGTMQVRVGPVSGVFSSHVLLKDLRPPESYTMEVEGKALPGHVSGAARVTLREMEKDRTLMSYEAEVRVGGLLASVGQRLLETVAKSMIRQSLEALDEVVRERRNEG